MPCKLILETNEFDRLYFAAPFMLPFGINYKKHAFGIPRNILYFHRITLYSLLFYNIINKRTISSSPIQISEKLKNNTAPARIDHILPLTAFTPRNPQFPAAKPPGIKSE